MNQMQTKHPRFQSYLNIGIILILIGISWQSSLFAQSVPDGVNVNHITDDIPNRDILFSGPHKFFEGDVAGAHLPDFDDSNWETTQSMWFNPRDLPENWTGTRWYRLYMRVDSTMFNEKLALRWFQNGAAEFWVNGELAGKTGVVSNIEEDFEYGDYRGWIPFRLSADSIQVIAIKHANPRVDFFRNAQWWIGLNFFLTDISRSYHTAVSENRFVSGFQWFIVSFCLVFGIIHLFFFLFNRKLVFNLWFSLACFAYAFGAWVQQEFFFYTSVELIIILQLIMQACMALSFMFIMIFMYSVLNLKMNRYVKTLIGLTLIVLVLHVLRITPNLFLIIFAVLLGMQIIYVTGYAIYKKVESSWLLGSGVVIFILSIFLVLALELTGNFIEEIGLSIFHAPYFGFGVALVGMSLFQSRHLAKLNMDLLQKLTEVKDLSEKNLEHERNLREADVRRARLETENERKTLELEKARALQLSLLPNSLPSLKGYAMHADMFTATEVGGDYYDFIQPNENRVIWALGDATGHGTDAGFVVAMTKTLFRSYAPEFSSDSCLRAMSARLKESGLHKRYMCLGLLEIQDNEISWCAAGIPPVIIYRKQTGKTEFLESKGMPLGSVTNFPYHIAKTKIEEGDIILVFSDGISEQMNSKREEMGYDRISECLIQNVQKLPSEIISELVKCMKNWAGENPQQDDVSLICLKRG